MIDPSKNDFQKVTEELYKKNLDLVNANKEMALLQKLYEIMAIKLNIKELAQEFIETIITDLDMPGGIVTLRLPKTHQLQNIAMHFNKGKSPASAHIDTSESSVCLRADHDENPLCRVFQQQEKVVTNKPEDILNPFVKEGGAKEIMTAAELESAIVYPLSFGHHNIAVMTVFLHQKASDLIEFEKSVLGNVSTVFGVALDRVMIYQDLKKANKELKALDKLKDEFVSIASHELRTPLTAIKGYLWMAINQSPAPLPEEVKKNLEIAHGATQRLGVLVEDMLTISRIAGGRLKFSIAEYDIVKMLQEVFDELKIRAEGKSIDLQYNHTLTEQKMQGDKEKIREVVINLVGNSLKFTPEKGTVKIDLTKVDNKVNIAVSDTGPGISKDDMGHVRLMLMIVYLIQF